MKQTQHTLANEISFSGVGLHSGVPVNMTLKPAPADHGIVFRRTDLPGTPEVPADIDYVTEVQRCTTLQKGAAKVQTTEHILAALVALEIDHALIELDAAEIPIMDGSAAMFIEKILSTGLTDLQTPRDFLEITDPVDYIKPDQDVRLTAFPRDGYHLTVMVDYHSAVLGKQQATLSQLDDFPKEIAKARTFCFLHELEYLYKHDLIMGGDLGNAVVIAEHPVSQENLSMLAQLLNKSEIRFEGTGILNDQPLYWPNEPARHKLLDLMGDLALLGKPLKAQIMAKKTGHAVNAAFVKMIRANLKSAPKVTESKPDTSQMSSWQCSFPETKLQSINLQNQEKIEITVQNASTLVKSDLLQSMIHAAQMLVTSQLPSSAKPRLSVQHIDQFTCPGYSLTSEPVSISAELTKPIHGNMVTLRSTARTTQEVYAEALITVNIEKSDL